LTRSVHAEACLPSVRQVSKHEGPPLPFDTSGRTVISSICQVIFAQALSRRIFHSVNQTSSSQVEPQQNKFLLYSAGIRGRGIRSPNQLIEMLKQLNENRPLLQLRMAFLPQKLAF
jgi:hypothetical protein